MDTMLYYKFGVHWRCTKKEIKLSFDDKKKGHGSRGLLAS